MFTLRQASVKMALLLHKQAKVPFVLDLAVYTLTCLINGEGLINREGGNYFGNQ